MNKKNEKKLVLISGASRGIGRACAIKFAKKGYNLSLCAIERMDLLSELKKELEAFGVSVLIKQCDVSDSTQVKEWISETYKTFKRIDVLVSNAGIAKYSLLVNTSEEDWDKVINTNLKGAFLLSKEVYDIMVSQKSGSIVLISSIWGKLGGSLEAVYSSSKAGLIALGKSLAKELAPSNIRVNVLAPGAVNTDMLNCISKEDINLYASETPLQRIAEPYEIADSVYFLSSDDSSFITGTVLSIDGGNS